MNKIIHSFHIDASPDTVYRALTTEEGLAGWWTEEVTVDSGVGGVLDFHFLEGFNPDMQVTALDERELVRWKCVGGHDNWQDNTFSFDLQASEGGTSVTFVQVYAEELSDEVYGEYNYNWAYYLRSLKNLCETGQGTPFQPT